MVTGETGEFIVVSCVAWVVRRVNLRFVAAGNKEHPVVVLYGKTIL